MGRLGGRAIAISLVILGWGTTSWADTTSGPFGDLQLMEERAAYDRDQRGVAIIRYVRVTPLGKQFIVDTESKVIEVEIVLMDEKKISKSLEKRTDQKLLVEYHRKVKVYGEAYRNAVVKVRVGMIKEAGWEFDGLAGKFPEHASAWRGKAAISLVSGEDKEAELAAKRAMAENSNDAVARALWGFALLKAGNIAASMNEKAMVRGIDPKWEHVNSWEVELVRSKNAQLYHQWTGLQ